MCEEFDKALDSYNASEKLKNIWDNEVMKNLVRPMVRFIPFGGDLIDTNIDSALARFQSEKEEYLIQTILDDNQYITPDRLGNVEFIINFGRVLEAVRRLARNEKVVYFAMLIKNGYFSETIIENDEFQEYLEILNTMTYREIRWLVTYKTFCEGYFGKKMTKGKVYGAWDAFVKQYRKKYPDVSLYAIFSRLKRTGFVEELLETESGSIDTDLNEIDNLSVEGTGFIIDRSFQAFYKMILQKDFEVDEDKTF